MTATLSPLITKGRSPCRALQPRTAISTAPSLEAHAPLTCKPNVFRAAQQPAPLTSKLEAKPQDLGARLHLIHVPRSSKPLQVHLNASHKGDRHHWNTVSPAFNPHVVALPGTRRLVNYRLPLAGNDLICSHPLLHLHPRRCSRSPSMGWVISGWYHAGSGSVAFWLWCMVLGRICRGLDKLVDFGR